MVKIMNKAIASFVLGLSVVSLILYTSMVSGSDLNEGDLAPNFNLQDQNGEWHSLEDYKGQYVVLFFYPKDGTPGCTTEACSFRDNIFEFKSLDTQILGVSLDDVDSHQEFSEKYSLPYPILADVNQDCADDYGVLGKFMMMTIAKRQSFIIDPQGRILKHYSKVNPDSHTNEVIEDQRALEKISNQPLMWPWTQSSR